MRIAWACGAGALVFTIVSSRLVDLHVGKHEEYSRIAAEKNTVRQVIPAKRGLILDRNGDKLAVNLPVHTVFADASHIKDAEQVSDLVARFLELKREEVAQKIATGGNTLSSNAKCRTQQSSNSKPKCGIAICAEFTPRWIRFALIQMARCSAMSSDT